MAPQNIIAVIFDFDDTLTDDSTTKLLESYNVDVKYFWTNRSKTLVDQGWSPPMAYLNLMLDLMIPGGELEGLDNKQLREFGKKLTFYEGIPELFGELKSITEGFPLSRPSVEFYVISGGLEEVIRGSSISSYFNGIWGCRFSEKNGRINNISNAISFTEKTKYLFEINKGVHLLPGYNPYSVNEEVALRDRRIPFENMIYLGDGLTDVPCFTLINKSGTGRTFGVFDPKRQDPPKKHLRNWLYRNE